MKRRRKTFIDKVLIFGVLLTVFSNCADSQTSLFPQETGSFTDQRDGKIYKTIKIADQWIMAENFAFKPAQGNYWAFNNDTANIAKYGYLYDWETAKKVAPPGWHLPSKEEWVTFRKTLGGKRAVRKYSQIIYEPLVNGGSSGFNALLAGQRDCKGKFRFLDERAEFWSSTDSRFDGPWHFDIDRNKDSIPHGSAETNKGGFASLKSYECYESGKSVRLFKD